MASSPSDELHPPIDRPEYVRTTGFAFGPRANFIVTFNQALQPLNPAFPPNWSFVFQNSSWIAQGASISGVSAFVTTVLGAPAPGPDRTTYLATPADVKALDDGADALPFADQPF